MTADRPKASVIEFCAWHFSHLASFGGHLIMAESDDGSSFASRSVPPLVSDEGSDGTDNRSLYKYRDFSSVPAEADGPIAPASRASGNDSSIRVQKFPVKLYAILAQKEFQDVVSWMPHGRSWKVLKPSLFESIVMPLFFEYSNYHSFNRLVNAWSFRRVSSGPDRGSYYHEVSTRTRSLEVLCRLETNEKMMCFLACRLC